MRQFIIIPDSFKESLTSKQICTIFKESSNRIFPNVNVISIPLADGGEGSVDAFSTFLKGKLIKLKVKGPYFEEMEVNYFLSNNKEAFIEVASCAGLSLVTKKDPSMVSTFGVGEQIKDAIKKGAKTIYVCLGGSASNDAGLGACSALGVIFKDDSGRMFVPTGKTISKIKEIDRSLSDIYLENVKIIGLCDVTNPMHGINGASYVFAKQKGASKQMIKELDDNLKFLDSFYKEKFNIDISNIKGSGAAGAFGSGILALLNGKLESGAETLIKLSRFDSYLDKTDIIFTGEGKLDKQSLHGKLLSVILKHAKAKNVPVIAICGGITSDISKQNDFAATISTTRLPMTFKEIKDNSKEFYKETIDNVLKLIKIGKDKGHK